MNELKFEEQEMDSTKHMQSSLVKIKRTLTIAFVIFTVIVTAIKSLQKLKSQA